MLQKIPAYNIRKVVELLQAYLKQKILNNKLKTWKKLKQQTRKQKILFSTSSFARNPSYTTRIPQISTHHALKNNVNTDHLQSKMFSHVKYRHKRNDDDEQFQQQVLKRIQAIETRFSTLKSQKDSSLYQSSSSTLRYKTEAPIRDGEGIRFGLNAKYIPMRESLKKLQPKIFETEQSQIYNNASQEYSERQRDREQGMEYLETPRIGRRKQSHDLKEGKPGFEISSHSLFDQCKKYDKKQKRKGKNYCHPYTRLLDQEEASQSCRSNQRVLSHRPLMQNMKQSQYLQENVENIEKQTLGYHPTVGYFKMIPIGKKLNLSQNICQNGQKIINFHK